MTIEEHPVENFRRLRIVVIGAGFSGIYCGIKLPELLRNIDLTIYDKNEGLGGTWWENRYPGCACDIPAHSYVYSFEPNPYWSNFYASAPEIQQYLEGVAKKYSVGRFVKCSHKVVGSSWDQDRKKWSVKVENLKTGETFDDEADVVIQARGLLNDYRWPDIEGLQSFEGKLVHSANWDTSYDYSNKRVGVIGAGSSAIQIVPSLQRLEGMKLNCFIRSKTWIARPFGEAAMEKLHFHHENFTPEEKEAFLADPKGYHHFRKTIETEGNAVHIATIKDSDFSKMARELFTEDMRSKLKKKPEIAEKVLPDFSVGCKRLTPGPGFLEALAEDNVDFISTPIRRIVPQGIELEDGTIVELDALVCATGFKAGRAPPFQVTGVNGVTLQQRFDPYPEAYMSVAVDGFPNWWLMMGPNSGVGSGSLTKIIESVGDYIVKCIRKLQKENIRSMHIKESRVRDFNAYAESYFRRTVYLDNCKSWYRIGDRIFALWPGSTLHAIETFRSPRWEDYEYEYDAQDENPITANRLSWLGNGWSSIQLEEDGDMSYYIEPEFVDFPSAPLPEDTPRWKKVAFTY
ncbi:putative monooxygenase [Rhizodiscina lignyota]|uniref:Monooxygenase n=1 Tax=Rhizodiscina lignyota TaxID=1504668 RepID=A0A9P4IS30_9PEZI|nr:putative monooxygenase [Rhizodiscina lignyota]